MTRATERIVDGTTLGTSAGVLYTSPTGIDTMITKLTFTNSTASDRTFSLYLVPSGQSVGQNYILIDALTVKAHSTFACWQAEGHVVEAGGTIQGLASTATAITVIGTGEQIT